MADNTISDGIIDSLAFAVEALPQENVLELSNTSKATPLNLKIRVRKKDKALFEQGVVSVPKLGQPKKPPERIRIVSSDQTVLSFKVFVDTQPDKKPAKKHKRFFRGCLSSEDYDDDPYEDKNFATVSRSSIAKQNFGLSKTENLTDMQLQPKKPVKFLGNMCKPGGCLDPPIDEDKYAYEPIDTFRHLFTQAHIFKKQKEDFITNETFMKKVTAESILKDAATEESETDKYEIMRDNKSIQSIYQADFIKSTLVARYSGSIITYSLDEIPDEICDKPSSPKRTGDKTRKSFPEFQDNYFIPPKSDTKNRNNNNADRIMPKMGTSFTDRYTSDNVGIFPDVEAIDNTEPNLPIYDHKHRVDPEIISSIDIEKIQTKTSTLIENNSNFNGDTNRLQNEKDKQNLKERNASITVLKTGTAVTTPLLAAIQRIQSDKDINEVKNESDNDNNFIVTEMNTTKRAPSTKGIFESLEKKDSNIVTSKETKKPQSPFESMRNDSYQEVKVNNTTNDENATQQEIDRMRDFSFSGKNERNKIFETKNVEDKITSDSKKLTEENIQSANEISKKTEENYTSHDFYNRQVYTIHDEVTDTVTIDQHLEKHSSNEDSYTKENKDIISEASLDSETSLIEMYKVQIINHAEENKGENSKAGSYIETGKDLGVSNYMEANKNKSSMASSHIEAYKNFEVMNDMDANINESLISNNHIKADKDLGVINNMEANKNEISISSSHVESDKKFEARNNMDANTDDILIANSHIKADKDLGAINNMEANKNKISIASSHIEEDKDLEVRNNMEANKNKSSIASSHIETDKDLGLRNYMEKNNNKRLTAGKEDSQINIFQSDQYDRKSGKSECIKERYDSINEQQKNLEQTQATKGVKMLLDTNTLVDHENLNKDQQEGTLIENFSDNANMHDIVSDLQHSYKVQRPIAVDIDSQNKDTNQNRGGYEDDDESYLTFNQTLNSTTLDNSMYYENGDHEKQHDTKHQDFDKNQETDFNYNSFDRMDKNEPLFNIPRHISNNNEQQSTKNDKIDQDSNKYPKVDLGDNDNKFAQNNDSLSNIANNDNSENGLFGTKNYLIDQDSNNSQDITLSSNKFDRLQNNDTSYKNQHYIEDKNNDEGVVKNMLKLNSYQETTATGGIKSDMTDESTPENVLQQQNVQRSNTLKATHHQGTTLHSDKDRNSKVENLTLNFNKSNDLNENKAIGKYDEHYGQPFQVDNFVNMDIAFHSYTNDKNQTVIETLNTSKDIKRRPQDNVTVIKTQASLNTPHVINIPIDNYRKVIVELKTSDHLKPSSYRTAGSDIRESDNEENFPTVPSQTSQTSLSEIESAQNLLTTVYEQLLPLQSLISDLRKDVDILTSQQMLLKENLKKSKRSKPIRLTHSSRKCICTSTYRRSNIKK